MKISIPQPCHENWKDMLPSEKGRFCLSCQKCVTDFKKLTDQEIFEIIQRPSQCGRFSQIQLDLLNKKLKQENRIVFPQVFRYSTLMIGLGLSGILVAQEKDAMEIVDTKTEKNQNSNSDSKLLKVNVYDADGFPIQDAFVELKNNLQFRTFTDENGYFEILIPNKNDFNFQITDAFGNMDEFNLVLDKINKINFNSEPYLLGLMPIITKERTVVGKAIHTLSWPFRQIGKLF